MKPDFLDDFAEKRMKINKSISNKSAQEKLMDEIPTYYDYLLVLTFNLVRDENKVAETIAYIFDSVLDGADLYETNLEHVFLVGINFKEESPRCSMQMVFNKLRKYSDAALVNGFVDILVYRYPSLFCVPDNHVKVEKIVFKDCFSKNKPLRNSIVGAIAPINDIGHSEECTLTLNSQEILCKK